MKLSNTLLALGLTVTLSQANAVEPALESFNEPDVIAIKPLPSFGYKAQEDHHILPHDLMILESTVEGLKIKGNQSREAFIKDLSKDYFLNLLQKPEHQHIHNSIPDHGDETLEGIAKAIGKWLTSAKVGIEKQALLVEEEAEDFFHKILEGVKEAKAHIEEKLSAKQEGDQ